MDSVHLLEAISAWADSNGRTVSVLLELHLGAEETKHGLTESEILTLLGIPEAASDAAGTPKADATVGSMGEGKSYRNIRFCGLMGMATNTEDEAVIRSDFERISRLFRTIRARLAALQSSAPQSLFATFRELSIGMSGDWRIALEYGATLIRVGTAIFGAREY